MKETSGTLTNTTVAFLADLNRRGLIISNNSDTVMTYSPTSTTATASIGIAIPANTAIILKREEAQALITSAGSVFCAGTSKAYSIYEWS